MTGLLIAVALFYFAFAIYLAALNARTAERPGHFVDGGLTIPSWALVFGSAGIMLAGLNLHDHLLLIRNYGLQYSHVTVGFILVALTAALVQKRVWLAARILRLRTVGDLMGEYYGSTALRIVLLGILFLFSVPFAAYCLAEAGALIASATDGAVPAGVAMWTIAFFLFLFSVIGGWRAIAIVVAAQSFLVLALFLFTSAFAGLSFHTSPILSSPLPVPDGILPSDIPGVVQFTAGIGKELPVGGIWTTAAILSFALALTGIVLSPGFNFLGITAETKKGYAFSQVWMIAALAAGAILILAPSIAAHLTLRTDPFGALIAQLTAANGLASVSFVLMILASLQIAVAFFAGSGASIATVELVGRFVLPNLDGGQERLSARIALAAIYLSLALAATFTPLSAAIFTSLALSLSAQMLPAFLGLCWLPWISRGGVLAGFIIGIILVIFTEPFGLIAFEGLFVDLPWGRWPLTIHSAGWGLLFNLAACLLVSAFTRGGYERDRRQRLHDEFAANHRAATGGGPLRAAKWSLAFIWTFLALGPGAILGNTFFSQPVFTEGTVSLGLPSLLAWQILFWLTGVLIVWWLAYPGRMSVIDAVPDRSIVLGEPVNSLERQPRPAWITRLLQRLAER